MSDLRSIHDLHVQLDQAQADNAALQQRLATLEQKARAVVEAVQHSDFGWDAVCDLHACLAEQQEPHE